MPPRRIVPAARPLCLGYIRVSTADQASDGASLPAQESALREKAAGRGWDLEIVTEAGLSAKNMQRPALLAALERLDRGEAQILAAVRLDRLSRSTIDFAELLERAKRRGWRVVVADVDVDTTTPAGELVVSVMAAVAQFERRIIGLRTKEGMAQRKAEGKVFGAEPKISETLVGQIIAMREAGHSSERIARTLTEQGTPTPSGRSPRWGGSTVRKVLTGATAARLRTDAGQA